MLRALDFKKIRERDILKETREGDKEENDDKKEEKVEDDEDRGNDDDECHGDMGLGSYSNTYSDEHDGEDDGVVVERSTHQVPKTTLRQLKGHVLNDLDTEDKVGGSVSASSPIQGSNDEQTQPTETSSSKVDKTWGFKTT
ncbi:hypothetical protein L1987_80504 [Smallanthus sonchifolius]|uniref:Uncharacterized protein n=1 Tax=Smallanthus sonchifolius TaxID=185202 RepID=A0ACB8YS31_9ASTR|nr:hypothetical protein L1987_80504 [Smallanthus sonchifolius]